MKEADKGRLMMTIGVSGWIFLLVPAHPRCPRQNPQSCKTVVCECLYSAFKSYKGYSGAEKYTEALFGDMHL